MSIKIYNGLKYKYKDLNDVGKFHRKLINIAQEHYSVLYNQKMSAFTLDVIICVIAFHSNDLKSRLGNVVTLYFSSFNDEAVTDHVLERTIESIMNVLDRQFWEEDDIDSLFSIIKAITTAMNFLFITDCIFNNVFYTKISLFYNEDYVLFIPHDDSDSRSRGDNGGMLHQRLMKISGVEEYHYQNSTDQPEHISEKDWERRYEEWRIASSSFQQTMNFSNCSDILVNNPNQTNVMPIMYTLNKNSSLYYYITKEFIQNMYQTYNTSVDSTFRQKIESTIDTSSVEDKNWMLMFKYVNRMTNHAIGYRGKEKEEFKERCDEVFQPLFEYFDLKVK